MFFESSLIGYSAAAAISGWHLDIGFRYSAKKGLRLIVIGRGEELLDSKNADFAPTQKNPFRPHRDRKGHRTKRKPF